MEKFFSLKEQPIFIPFRMSGYRQVTAPLLSFKKRKKKKMLRVCTGVHMEKAVEEGSKCDLHIFFRDSPQLFDFFVLVKCPPPPPPMILICSAHAVTPTDDIDPVSIFDSYTLFPFLSLFPPTCFCCHCH